MLPVFRKLRRSLLVNNKLGKYLVYAIGEIVLVVIGILIALQVNKEVEAGKRYDLETDIAEQHDLAAGFSGWLDDLRLSDVLRYPESPVPDSKFEPDRHTVGLYHFNSGAGDLIVDSSPGGQSPGERRFGIGGGVSPGPEWSESSPFTAGPARPRAE